MSSSKNTTVGFTLAAVIVTLLSPLQSLARQRDSRADQDSRPRRVEYKTADGPVIRVGLMRDVASVTVSAPFGINARRLRDDEKDRRPVYAEARVEVRSAPVAAPQYRVEVISTSDAATARRTSDEVKKKFREQVSTTYDAASKKYTVLIGQFESREEASNMVERLRRADFKSARVAMDSKDAIADDEKRGYQPRYTQTPARAVRQNRLQLVAFDAGKLVASSDDLIIITPAESQEKTEPTRTVKFDRDSAVKNERDQNSRRDEIENDRAVTKPLAVKIGNREYRGEIHLALNERGRINVINALPLEQYLRGVVPMELSPGAFPEIEALKAQAVAARSYAISQQGRYSAEGFDLRDDAYSQVYGGLTAERPLTNRAVEETRGMVAMHRDEEGRDSLIEALYTSTCGGRTENNEAIFLGRPLPYLRSVECAPDSQSAREVKSNRQTEIVSADGRMLGREIAIMDVAGFSIPSRIAPQYLRAQADRDELFRWADNLAALARRPRPRLKGDVTRLPAFASLIASALYGESRASLLLSSADVDYILTGLGGDDIAREMRADIALLLKEGILRLAENRLSASITRAFAVETIARALYLKPQLSNLKSAASRPAESGRLAINSDAARSQAKQSATDADRAAGFEIEKNAWLFRRLGGESYATNRLTIIGGEKITYHLNLAGRVDFLEAEVAERGAASDRFSSVSYWQERVSADELKRRLARLRSVAGEIDDLAPVEYGASGRVIELDVVSGERKVRLRGHQIRSALGLKENLFVIDTERDERGRPTVFIFTGRGWGHGVGLCQTGAYGLAKEGYSYSAILQKYYTGVKVKKIY
ncbi:MAG: SpoIID/LytB domain-containing protein [Acidobacteriota bacterium]